MVITLLTLSTVTSEHTITLSWNTTYVKNTVGYFYMYLFESAVCSVGYVLS